MAILHQSSFLCSLALFTSNPKLGTISRFKTLKLSSSKTPSDSESSSSDPSNSLPNVEESEPDRVKLAFDKAKEYKKSFELNKFRKYGEDSVGEFASTGSSSRDSGEAQGKSAVTGDKNGATTEIPDAVRIEMEKAKEYKNNEGMSRDNNRRGKEKILTGERKGNEKEELKISSIDFMGLDFAEKKNNRRVPAGLVPVADPFLDNDFPEVELLVGDASKFQESSEQQTTPKENSDLYKPKVSTWGLFTRPNNISKAYGGGRNIRPGEALETAEDRATKEARTRQLLAAYNTKIGLNIDPKLNAECQKALREGDSLMDVGKMKEALPYYQQVMDKLAFQSELHGLAALQWSICQDSLSRAEEARVMYEKLQSHPNAQVSKRARQFMFSFQAMEIMRVMRSNLAPRNTGYSEFFDAFIEDKAGYGTERSDVGQGDIFESLLYIIFLASPILLVLLIVVKKGM